MPAYLGNNILGQFGLMGRIGESVRSKAGLAYSASSGINAWADGGSWEFSAGLNPENLDKAVRLIRDEIERYISAPVTSEELDDSQSNLIGRLPLSLETNAGIANAILTIERFVRPGLLPALHRKDARHYTAADTGNRAEVPAP